MTDNDYKLIERGRDNEMLALLEWLKDEDHIPWGCQWTNAELLERFKNRNK